MKTTHTPGPWHVEDGDVFSTTENVANVFGADSSLPEAQANARLIAAAPDLLAALDEIASNPEAETLATSRKDGHHEAYTLAGIARAALAKAKG